jgi:GNAT superfamily N-acetyltransferase
MKIRNLKVDDFFLLNELDWTPLPRERDSIYLTMVAEDDGGAFLGVLLASRGAAGDSIYINHLLIAPGARKLGLGSRLMAALEDYALNAGVRRIWFHCQDETVEYYGAKGFAEDYSFFTPELKKYLREVKGVHTMSKFLEKK